jgi:hypothetical protein
MSSDVRQTGDQIQGQTFEMMRQGQEAVVRAIQTWSDGWAQAVQQFTPRSDGGAAPQQGWLQPQELVNQVFDFGQQLLNIQREFAQRMMEAAAPMWQAAEEQTQQAAQTAKQQTPKPKTGGTA